MLSKASSICFLLLVAVNLALGGRIARDDHETDEPAPTKKERKIVITMIPEDPVTTTTTTVSPEKEFYKVTKALTKTIQEMEWPDIKQREDDDNIFGYRVTDLEVSPFYVRSAEFSDDLSIKIMGAFGQAKANFYVSKEIDLWFYKETFDLEGSMNLEFSDVNMIADLDVSPNNLMISIQGCKSEIGEVDVNVNVTSDSWWQQLLGDVINAMSWLFSGWVTDIMNDELCPGFETVLKKYPDTFLRLAQSVIENSADE